MPTLSAAAVERADGAGPSAIAGSVGDRSTTGLGTSSAVAADLAPALDHYLPVSQLAARYGIRITLIAVTAAGGLVDLRFKVLDPGKARTLVGEPPTMPALVPMGSDLKLVTSHMMMHAIQLKKDRVSYALYPNVRSAVKPGGRVSVVFNDVRVEPIVVR